MSESRDGDTEEHGGASSELKLELGPGATVVDRFTPGCPGQIKLERFRTPHRIILRKFDNDNDGRIDATEIQSVVTTLMTEQFKSKAFRIGLIILALFTAVLLGALFGLTWAVVAALKDTQVNGDVLVTNDKAAQPIMIANLEVTVDSGKLVSRSSSAAVATATLQTRGAVSTQTPFDKLLSMQSLTFVKGDGSTYSLNILGVARIPDDAAEDGFVLRFQTEAGTLSLENGTWAVTNMTGTLMENLFTETDGRGRRLQSSPANYYVICDGGECGDPIPCGMPGYDACPPSPPAAQPRPPPPPSTSNVGSGAGQTCATISRTGLLSSCIDGLSRCYFPVTSDKRSRYLSQVGCQSSCPTGWVVQYIWDVTVNAVVATCTMSSSGTQKEYCCP